MAPKSAKFTDGERILCFHGPLMYEAKCIKSELRESNKGYYYLIHYNGWNKHWDEWVPESRVLKYNDSNLQRQRDLLKQHGKDKSKRGKPAKFPKPDLNGKESFEKARKSDSGPSTSEPKKKRSRLESSVEREETYLNKLEVKVRIPDKLKSILVDDWDLISRQKRLYSLTAKVTIEEILNSYVEKNSSSVEKSSTVQELVSGITEYFNVMLGAQLLYRFERTQYSEIMSQNPTLTMTQIYGFPHLIRLFVKVGTILSYTNLDEENMAKLVKHMQEFLDYLQDNASLLFSVNDYETTSYEYQKKS